MSRSYRRSTFHGYTCSKSDKPWKKEWHSRMRAMERANLSKLGLYSPVSDSIVEVYDEDGEIIEIPVMEYPLYDGQDYITTEVKEACNVWDSPKDGKYYFSLEKMRKMYLGWPRMLKRYGSIERIMHRLMAK